MSIKLKNKTTNKKQSTLVNVLVGEKVAIVSPKPQTTRDRILGVWNTEGAQVAFVDTPGIYKSKTALSDLMMRTAEQSALKTAIPACGPCSPSQGRRNEPRQNLLNSVFSFCEIFLAGCPFRTICCVL